MSVNKTCLVVDDSEVIREIAVRIMSDLGVDADEAENAASAVEYCREKKPGVVLLDWDLPGMGALDFLRGAGELPADEKPEIILCATENDLQQFTLAKAAGAAHYILKPFDKRTVSRKLQEIGLLDGEGEAPKAAANS